MTKENKKISKLNIAISLAVILFTVVLIITVKGKGKISEGIKKETITVQQIVKPMVKKIEEPFLFEDKQSSIKEEDLKQDEDEELPAVALKDIPLEEMQDKARQGEEKLPEEIEVLAPASPQTQPSLEDMKLIKKKGLVIY